MRQTKLILVEGLPGSGKSTLAQFLTWCLREEALDVRWWYEEELGHPVYVFHDRDSLGQTVAALNQGDYAAVVDAALKRWRHFAVTVANGTQVVLLDSCLFGYLTWSLFPLDVPERVIAAYVAEVARIIAAVDPCLIYLYQDDVAVSLRRICTRRGEATEQRLMEQSMHSQYGRSRHLSGFDGMVAYWSAYRHLTGAMYDFLLLPKVAIETTAGDWLEYQRQAVAFLGLSLRETPRLSRAVLDTFTGTFDYAVGDEVRSVTIVLAEGGLTLRGMPEIWQDTPLRPVAENRFAIESLPFEVRFVHCEPGNVTQMAVSGPELLGGTLPRLLVRRTAATTN